MINKINFSTVSKTARESARKKQFKILEQKAIKTGIESAIFRDNIALAKRTVSVLEKMKSKGLDLSNIRIIISKKAAERSNFIIRIKPMLETVKKLVSSGEFNTKESELAIKEIYKKYHVRSLGGLARQSIKGDQHPLVILNPSRLTKTMNQSLSTQEKEHNIAHEIFHALHFKKIFKDYRGSLHENKDQALASSYKFSAKEVFDPAFEKVHSWLKNSKKQNVNELDTMNFLNKAISKVSDYCIMNPLEFVAEFACVKFFGKQSRRIRQPLPLYYEILKGPVFK